MTDPRWIHLPDGPWVLPNEDSDVYVRLITKTETAGRPTFTLTGPGYDATEHATLDEAMAEAEFYRFEPVDDRPPMPTQSPPPKELFVLQSVWERWRGSTTAIAALAKRADEWMDTHWTSFQKLPKKAWYVRPGVLRQQYFVISSHSVTTTFWSGGVTADALQGELEARRDLVRLIKVESTAIVRSWPVTVCDDLPLTPAELPAPPPGVSVSSETVASAAGPSGVSDEQRSCGSSPHRRSNGAAVRQPPQAHTSPRRRREARPGVGPRCDRIYCCDPRLRDPGRTPPDGRLAGARVPHCRRRHHPHGAPVAAKQPSTNDSSDQVGTRTDAPVTPVGAPPAGCLRSQESLLGAGYQLRTDDRQPAGLPSKRHPICMSTSRMARPAMRGQEGLTVEVASVRG